MGLAVHPECNGPRPNSVKQQGSSKSDGSHWYFNHL